MKKSTHLDERGRARMMDVSEKPATKRRAHAVGEVVLGEEAYPLVRKGEIKKGDVLAVAQLAGIQAAKRTWETIPLCHPIPIESIEVSFAMDEARYTVVITAKVTTTAKTGVEMEALTAVAGSALTIYDMCKSVSRDIVIGPIRLMAKSGGKSGDWKTDL